MISWNGTNLSEGLYLRVRLRPMMTGFRIGDFAFLSVKGSPKNNLTELVHGFGSGLADLIERSRRNSGLFRGFRE